jgi:general secretion pathway protein K
MVVNPRQTRHQQGAVLVVAIMMVAFFTSLAVLVQNSQQSVKQRTGTLLEWDRRYQYAMAAEVVAIQGLIDDLESDRNSSVFVDECEKERWAIRLPPSPYEDAMISATVQDLQGRFNLNNVVNAQSNEFVVDAAQRQGLQRLLAGLLTDGTVADTLAWEMADWLDSNNLVDGVEGAEDAEYRFRRTPNMPIAHESELRALRSMTLELIPVESWFWPYFTALPVDTTVNINTAPPLVLTAVLDDVAAGAGQAAVSLRDKGPVENLSELWSVSPFKDMDAEQRQTVESLVGVSSEYFQVMIDVQVQDKRTRLVSRIQRSRQGDTRVISRQLVPIMGPLEPPCNPHYN